MRKVIERLLNLLAFLLTTPRPVTAEEIRMTVAGYDQSSDEAFRRMFERDKDLLRQLGVPLERRPLDAWEVEYGYIVPSEDYEMPDPHLTDEERAALWLAAQVVRLGGQPSGPDAVLKLGGSPMSGAGEPLAADLGLAADVLGDLFAAVDERRRVTFTYRDRRRRLDPYGLVHQRGHWYVVGHDAEAGEVRSYRVDRASEMRQAERAGTFERPPGFSVRTALPAAPWEAGAEDLQATVRFDDDAAWYARRQIPALAETRDVPGGFEVTLRVANTEAFLGWIIGFEAAAEIVAPPALRQAMIERVRGAA